MSSAKIIDFHSSSKVANYIRLGYSGHKMLEDLQLSGQLNLKRVVVDATNVLKQSELLSTLRIVGSDLILDTRSAELAHEASFKNPISKLPWAIRNRANTLEDFSDEAYCKEYVARIAEFAVYYKFNGVFSPSHSIDSIDVDWLSVDIDLSCLLREALDERGGDDITIEYPLITTTKLVNDELSRKAIINRLADAEFDNLWLRFSGFGNNATAAGIVKYINATRDFQKLNKPLVSDCVGGFVGLAVLAFGATGGISHGVAQKESFNLNYWTKESEWSGGFAHRIYLSDLDLFISRSQAGALFKEKGMKSLLACNTNNCCQNGFMDMFNNPNEHFLKQRFKLINDLNQVPESRRNHYFIEKILDPALRKSRKLLASNINDEKLKNKILSHTKKLDRIHQSLDNIYQNTNGFTVRALIPIRCRASSLIKFQRGEAS